MQGRITELAYERERRYLPYPPMRALLRREFIAEVSLALRSCQVDGKASTQAILRLLNFNFVELSSFLGVTIGDSAMAILRD